ncbi:MAG: NADH kinase [Rikenellaceae bacterium]|nr:NADH kinase [Rikenellaceae bacterium]
MKIVLFSRPQINHTVEDLRRLLNLIDHYGFDYAINQEFAAVMEQKLGIVVESEKIYGDTTGAQPAQSVMVCCGGDGTLLEGIHRLSDKTIPVAGINFGHLGFLTSATRDGVESLFEQIANRSLNIQPRSMLSIEGKSVGRLFALNEVAAQRLEATMIKVVASVDNQIVAQYNGDGVILSSPTGSTAYSLSAGGPIVSPDCHCFLITPLAPHNFGMRPVVIPDTAEVVLTIHTRQGKAMLSIDNRTYSLSDGETITIRRAEEQILLVTPHNISFYETLHSKMMWDVDIRN